MLLVDPETSKEIGLLGLAPNDGVVSVAFSPDGIALAVVGYGQHIVLWDLDVTREKQTLAQVSSSNFCAASADWKTFAIHSGERVAENRKVELLDAATGKKKPLATKLSFRFPKAAFTPDGKTLILADEDPQVRLWDVETDKERAVLDTGVKEIKTLLLSKDGKTLAVAANDQVQVWDVPERKLRGTLRVPGEYVQSLSFSSDARTLASADRMARIWDLDTLKQRHQLNAFKGDFPSGLVALSPDGKMLATATSSSAEKDWTIRLWDVVNGKELHTLKGHRYVVSGLVFTTDGKTLLSASHDSTIKAWDVETGRERATLAESPGPRTFLMSPDGKTFMLVGDRETKVWDTASVFAPLNANRTDVARTPPSPKK